MSGLAYSDEKPLLEPGASCIIRVDGVNHPTGLWWGTVISRSEADGDTIVVTAKISGGRLAYDGNGHPVTSDEEKGRIPDDNYVVYPDMELVHEMLHKFGSVEAELKKAKWEAEHWRQTHFDVMKNIVEHLKKMTDATKTIF